MKKAASKSEICKERALQGRTRCDRQQSAFAVNFFPFIFACQLMQFFLFISYFKSENCNKVKIILTTIR